MPRLLVDPGVYAADNGHSHKRVYALGIAILLTILSACGGGGGGGGTSSNPQTPPPPSTPVAITTTAVPDGTTGVNYSFVFKASGGSGIYNWSISGQTFGLSFSPSAGLLSGTSLNNGASSITVTATDSTSSTNTATKTFPFRMLVPYNWNGQTLSATAHLNAPYSLHLVLAPTASFQVTAGTLPPGMQITGSNSAGWQLSGVPTSAGTFNFTLQGSSTDNPPQLASQRFTLIVDTAFAISFPPQLPDAIFGNGYSVQLTTANTSGPVSWSAVGTPSGLSLDSATGTLSGTPAWGLAGVNELFSVTATETSTGKQAAQTFGITGFSPLGAYINAPSITLNRKFIDGVESSAEKLHLPLP